MAQRLSVLLCVRCAFVVVLLNRKQFLIMPDIDTAQLSIHSSSSIYLRNMPIICYFAKHEIA
jgi:hypothetical protein